MNSEGKPDERKRLGRFQGWEGNFILQAVNSMATFSGRDYFP
jgi:hypothetical protein